MSENDYGTATYKEGTVDVPNLGLSLRSIFGCAVRHHDIVRDGREFKVTLNGVFIGRLQLKDTNIKEAAGVKVIRKNPSRV